MSTSKNNRYTVRMMTATAVLSAVAFILEFLEFPVPLSPAFARMDLSDLPALIGAFAYGPVAGVIIELIKNLIHLTISSTGGVGELANFLMGSAYVYTAGAIYRHRKTRRMAWVSGIVGSVAMGVMAMITNYFILLPLFEQFMPINEIIASFGTFIPFIKTKFDVVLYNAFPFNLLKGLAISTITMFIYKKLSPVLKGTE